MFKSIPHKPSVVAYAQNPSTKEARTKIKIVGLRPVGATEQESISKQKQRCDRVSGHQRGDRKAKGSPTNNNARLPQIFAKYKHILCFGVLAVMALTAQWDIQGQTAPN